MSLSVETLAVARKYTDDSLAGVGAVAGVPCKIQSITAITGGNRVTFLWTDNNGDDHTSAMDVMDGVDGEDGKGIQSVTVNAQDHLIITYTDGTTVDAGQIEIHSAVDSVNGQTGAVVLDAEDVGALPDNTPIPSKTSDLTNDSGFATTSDVSTALADYTTTADLTTLLAAKQDTLTFDNAPTENSNNPVKSGGVYAANQTLTNNVDVLFETGVKNICPPYSGSLSSNGITYIGNSDGTVTVNGTCSANAGANIRVYLKAGQYKVSGCPSGGSYSTYRIGVTTDSWKLIGTHDHGNGTTITIPSDDYYRINLDVRAGYVANNLVFKPMITDVDTPESDYDHYVPYAKTNQQLTEDSVTWDNLSEVGAVNYLVYPYSETTHTSSNIIYTDNGDGSITVGTGTTSSGAPGVYVMANNTKDIQRLRGKTVKFLIDCDTIVNGNNANVEMNIFDSSNNLLYTHYLHMNGGRDETILTVPSNADHAYIQAWNKRGTTISTAYTVKPMIAPPSYNGPYVPPAKTNKELTDESKLITLPVTKNDSIIDTTFIVKARKQYNAVYVTGYLHLTVAANHGDLLFTISGLDFLDADDHFYVIMMSSGGDIAFAEIFSDGTVKVGNDAGIRSSYYIVTGVFLIK